jgi:type III secretion protein U
MSGQTELPTPRKRDDARKDGQVARSEDLTNVFVFGVLWAYLIVDGDRLGRYLVELISLPADYLHLPFEQALRMVVVLVLSKALLLVLGFLLVAVILSVLIQLIQIGPLWSTKSITPSLKKFNVKSNLQEIVSLNTVIDSIKMIAKTALLAWIWWLVVKGNGGLLVSVPFGGVGAIGYAIREVIRELVLIVFFAFSILAILDFMWQKHRLTKKLMMKKEEVKKEHKENEGDPHFKEHRRSLLKEILFGGEDRISQASAIVTNPTHLAVALYYEADQTPLPVVIAKGRGLGARTIVRLALRAGVPIVQNIPVARKLYQETDIDSYIPTDMLGAIAEVIAAAQQIRETETRHV